MSFKIKKFYLFVFIFLLGFQFLISQESQPQVDGDTSQTGSQQSQQDSQATASEQTIAPEGVEVISNIIINDFEESDRWFGGMSIDEGLIQVAKRKGAPEEIRATSPKSKFVIGAKVIFLRARLSHASIEPPTPIVIPGITKKLSVWAYGRGVDHELFAYVSDFKGRIYKFSFGKLDFNGWKKLEVEIPSGPDNPFFSQMDKTKETFYKTHGITFHAFVIEFDHKQAFGSFYVYLDNFSAESNVYRYEKELQIFNTPEDERLEPLDNW